MVIRIYGIILFLLIASLQFEILNAGLLDYIRSLSWFGFTKSGNIPYPPLCNARITNGTGVVTTTPGPWPGEGPYAPRGNLPTCSYDSDDIVRGRAIAGSTYQASPFPYWINLTLVKQGQAFGRKNRFSVSVGALNGLLSGLAFPDAAELLSFTAASDSAHESLKRYAATSAQMFVWYDTVLSMDLNDNAFLTSIASVREIHINAAKKANSQPKPINDPNKYKNIPTDDKMWKALLTDLESDPKYREHREFPSHFLAYNSNATYVNQFIQGVTLYGFIGLPVMYPEACYLHDGTNEEFRAFLHLWAVIGYIIGINDEFNICLRATVQQAKDYFVDVQNKYVIPGLFQIDKKGKVLVESFIDGFYRNGTVPGQSRRTVMLRLLRDFYKVRVPHMEDLLDLDDTAAMWAWDNVFTPSTKSPATRASLNRMVIAQLKAHIQIYFGPYTTSMDTAQHVFFPKRNRDDGEF